MDELLKRATITKDGCYLWNGAKSRGYGYKRYNKKNWRVHRLAYNLVKGSIPSGKVIDHLCRQKACFNVEHLELVTQRENLTRNPKYKGKNVRYKSPNKILKSACIWGHSFTEENTYKYPDGRRECVTCRKLRR